MKKIIIVIGLILVSCNSHDGKIIDDGIWICTKIIKTTNNCSYQFTTNRTHRSFQSDCDKWQIGDTL